MNFTPFARAAVVCSLLVFAPSLFAQQKKAVPVEVTYVKFSEADVMGSMLKMNRMEVRLRALANAKLIEDPKAVVPNKDWVDRIKVTVNTIYEAPAGPDTKKTDPQFVSYRAAVTIMTMEKNSQGSVFFYLPGEIVKRDRLKKEPYAYIVDIEVDGVAVETTKEMVSKNVNTAKLLAQVKEIADRGASDNAGVLRTQNQIPFSPGQPSSPTLLREDTTRM
ncbi:MAG: hypothetical protein LBV12_04845 [Puniceicoccales bacterium]|jgi:hypothetical protein|nr:hypothetical protein [Puniceicoccales bacterium]